MTVLVDRAGTNLLIYAGALLLAVVMGAAIAAEQIGPLLVAIVVVAILLEWRLGALMLPAVLPFEWALKGTLESGIKALALLTVLSLVLALLRDRTMLERFLRLWQQPLTLAVFLFALWALASNLWASNQEAALTKTGTLFGVFALMIIIGMLEQRYLVLLWVVAVLSVAASVPASYVLPQSGKMLEAGRLGTAGADPNSYACLLAIMFVVAYFGLRKFGWLAYLLAPVLFYGVFATLSRTGLIALAVTPLLLMFVPRLATRLGWRALLMYGLGAAALAVVFLAIPSVGESVSERYATLSQYEEEETWAGRWSMWEAALQIITSHPISGVGVGNYAYFAQDLSVSAAQHAADKGEISGVAHNMFLSVASELGFVGLALFVGVLFLAFRMALRVSQASTLGAGLFLGLVGFTIAGTTLTWEYFKLGYVLYGSVLALYLQQAGQRSLWPGKQESPR